MTRETKVGLIVGLAFIVVFAVILSHKGAQQPVGDLGPLAEATDRTPPGGTRSFPVGEARGAAHGQGGARSDPSLGAGLAAGGESREARSESRSYPDPVSAVRTTLTDGGPATIDGGRVPLASFPTDQEGNEEESLTPALNNWLNGTPMDTRAPVETVMRRQAPSERLGAAPESAGPAAPRPEPSESPAVPARANEDEPVPVPRQPIKQEYVVRPGDNLTKISKSIYGKCTPRELNAIVEANRKELASADKVHIGMKLVIPELPADKFEATTFPPSARSRTADGSRTPLTATGTRSDSSTVPSVGTGGESLAAGGTARDSRAVGDVDGNGRNAPHSAKGSAAAVKDGEMRMHTIREKETYRDIAQKYLGSGSRWKEIYDLNKTEFPDPQKLKVGARIRVPSNAPNTGALSKL